MEMKSRGMTSKEVKILLRFFISFVIILLFQMNMLKFLLIYKKKMNVSLYLMIEGEKTYTPELEIDILLLLYLFVQIELILFIVGELVQRTVSRALGRPTVRGA